MSVSNFFPATLDINPRNSASDQDSLNPDSRKALQILVLISNLGRPSVCTFVGLTVLYDGNKFFICSLTAPTVIPTLAASATLAAALSAVSAPAICPPVPNPIP